MAHIHWQNLANFGVLALEFADATDHGRIGRDDVLVLEGIREALAIKTEITVHNELATRTTPPGRTSRSGRSTCCWRADSFLGCRNAESYRRLKACPV